MALLIVLFIIMALSNILRREVFISGCRRNIVLVLFFITTGILAIFSYIFACFTFGSFIYIIAIINYIAYVIQISTGIKLIKEKKN